MDRINELYGQKIFSEGDILALCFGEAYNKNGHMQDERINPMSLNRYWVVISNDDQIRAGMVILLPIRSLAKKYDEPIPAQLLSMNTNSYEVSREDISIPTDANIISILKERKLQNGEFAAKSYTEGVIFSMFGTAMEIVCNMPRSFKIPSIAGNYMIKSSVSRFVLLAARAAMTHSVLNQADPFSMGVLNGFSKDIFEDDNNLNNYPKKIGISNNNYIASPEVPNTMNAIKNVEREMNSESSEEEEDELPPTILNVISDNKVIETAEMEQEQEEVPAEEPKEEPKQDNTIHAVSDELISEIDDRLGLKRVKRVSLKTMMIHINEAFGNSVHIVFSDVEQLKKAVNINEKAIIIKNLKGDRKELVNTAYARKLLKNLQAYVNGMAAAEGSNEFDYLIVSPSDWTYDQIDQFINHMITYRKPENLINASNMALTSIERNRIISYSGYCKKLKALKALTSIFRYHLNEEFVVDYKKANFSSSEIDEAIRECKKDLKAHPNWRVAGPDSTFILAKYCGCNCRYREGDTVIEDVIARYKKIDNNFAKLMTYLETGRDK